VHFAIATLATVAIGGVVAAIALARRASGPPPAEPSAARSEAAVPEPEPSATLDPDAQAEPEAHAPNAPDAPPARPKQLSVCRTGTAPNAGILCQELEGTCECKDPDGYALCEVRFSERCTYAYRETARTGDACSGFQRATRDAIRIDPPGTGKLRCWRYCNDAAARSQRRMAIPFTPCRGIWREDQTPQAGIWVPSGP
jgi:hypothetical protein